MGDFVKFFLSFLPILERIYNGLQEGKNLTLACRIFPAMARAIKGKVLAIF